MTSTDGPAVDDERWLVFNGRRWRRTDPVLPDDLVEALKSQLGSARSAVGVARRSGEPTDEARHRVDIAKHGLGERGPKWWESEPADRLARAREALDQLTTPRAGAPDRRPPRDR